jgi:transcriptional regulator
MSLYIPQHFRVEDPETLLGFMKAHGFVDLVSTVDGQLQASHVPVLTERGRDGTFRLTGHVARANPHWEVLERATDVVAIFRGPHAYVSPSWYQAQPSVPTWNYAVVHAHGAVRLMDEAELHETLHELAAKYEAGRERPWRMGDLPAAYVHGMLAQIVGFEMTVERLEGKFKLSQNRPAEIERVIAGLDRDGEAELAAMMRSQLVPAQA